MVMPVISSRNNELNFFALHVDLLSSLSDPARNDAAQALFAILQLSINGNIHSATNMAAMRRQRLLEFSTKKFCAIGQGLDQRSTGDLFLQAVCIGEKIINEEECFILKLDTSQSDLEAQVNPKYEIIHHTIWGYFSQRSGLLVKFEDSRLLTVNGDNGDGIFWETSTESVIEDYRYVEGVNIAHGGKTTMTIFRYGEQSSNHKREFEEKWNIEEVHFNVWGLNTDFFTPPSEITKEQKKQTKSKYDNLRGVSL
ncbi:polyol transporter like protein [Tanacetum coccineum]